MPDRLGSGVWETKMAGNIQINGDIWKTNKSTGLQEKIDWGVSMQWLQLNVYKQKRRTDV